MSHLQHRSSHGDDPAGVSEEASAGSLPFPKTLPVVDPQIIVRTASNSRIRRDVTVDVLRGLCIVSMATAHLAVGSASYQVLHAAVWVDGAVGFVFLAGLMLGRSQRRVTVKSSTYAARQRLLYRTGIIYAAHFFICGVAMTAVAIDPVRTGPYSGLTELGGPIPALGAVALLRVNPWSASILSLYVVLMVLSFGALELLRRRHWPLVMSLSLALYAVGVVWPLRFSFSIQPGVPGAVNWASWQFLFVLALVIGWHWSTSWVQARLAGAVLITAAGVLVFMVVWARLLADSEPANPEGLASVLFSGGTLGPGTIVMAVAAGVVLYCLVQLVARRAHHLVAPLARLGRRSLDCYLILSVLVIIGPLQFQYRRNSAVANVVVVLLLVLCWYWCTMRDRLDAKRQAASLGG